MDVAAAVVLATLALVSAGLETVDARSDVTRPFDDLAPVLVLAMTLPLAVRRRWPRTISVATTVVAAGAVLLGFPVGIGPFGAVFALHTLAATTPKPTTLALGIPCGALLIASLLASPGPVDIAAVVGNGLFILFALAAGILLRVNTEQRDELVERNRELTAARGAQVRSAVAEERLRIAREVHDAVGHALVGLTLHARAAKRRLGRDPQGTHDALGQIESLARQALDETRSAVSAMRNGVAAGDTPRLTTGSLRTMIASMQDRELAVDLDLDLGQVVLDAEQELAAFRIVQESLSNVARHAEASRAHVRVRVDDRTLVIEVDDELENPARRAPLDPGASTVGSGICGMRERAEQLGGNLTAGPTSSGWRVEARLPLVTSSTVTT